MAHDESSLIPSAQVWPEAGGQSESLPSSLPPFDPTLTRLHLAHIRNDLLFHNQILVLFHQLIAGRIRIDILHFQKHQVRKFCESDHAIVI